jgi:hypothetical protein
VGLFDYFRRRRERESAVTSLEVTADASAQVAPLGHSPAPGESDPARDLGAVQAAGLDLAQLGQIGAMIVEAAKQGQIQVHQGEAQTFDLRGSGLREEILGILSQHGIDPDVTSTESIDAGQMPEMQRQILDAINRQGVDLNAYLGTGDPSPGISEVEDPSGD